MSDEYDDPSSVGSMVVPIVAVGTALGVGLLAGGIIGWLLFDEEPAAIEVARDLTNEELEELCEVFVDEAVGEAVEEAADELSVAQERVATLQDDVFSKERIVAEMEAEMERRSVRGRALVAELAAARAELTELKSQLAQAVEEKEQLFRELRHTEHQLAEQKVETFVAREDALAFKWTTFLGASQLEICEKGGRRRMGRCREKIAETLPRFRDRFEHCIRSGQEMPGLAEIPRGHDILPVFSEWMDQEDRITRDWYVMLCDPTLPEAEGWETPALPTTNPEGL